LRQIAFLLERAGAPTYRVRAFRRAADVLESSPPEEIARRIGDGTLSALPGIGPVTAQVITEAAGGAEPAYLTRLCAEQPAPPPDDLRAALRGDCHTHSDWSDGGSPPLEMAEAARGLGHEWIALTDHSPRLTVAHGLSAQRLRDQLKLIGELNDRLAPFRILTGIEVDILDDGSPDQDEELLARLDVVVASVHSKLRMPAGPMTERMVTAVRNPHVDVLGHCTGRLVTGRGRPESAFDAAAVFGACRAHGVAVEINCRPERMDPPDPLLRLAAETGCLFAVDTDAHAPGQLAWQGNGTARAVALGIPPDRVINTRPAAAMPRLPRRGGLISSAVPRAPVSAAGLPARRPWSGQTGRAPPGRRIPGSPACSRTTVPG
jgi:putative hydrolase